MNDAHDNAADDKAMLERYCQIHDLFDCPYAHVPGKTDSEALTLVRKVLAVHQANVDDDDGDKFLSDPNLAIEAIEHAAYSEPDDLTWLRRNGYIG